MRWEKLRRSKNVEHRRGGGGGRRVGKGGGLGMIVMAVVAIFVFKQNPGDVLSNLMGGAGQSQVSSQPPTGVEAETEEFIMAIKGSTEDVWTAIFQKAGQRYRAPEMINYDGMTPMKSGGTADARMGPFYVPSEETIYLDTSFFQTMERTLGGGGDFAYAYVIAHEVGHHIQKLTGYTDKVHKLKGRVSEAQYNQQSVRLELQADFFAGVWAHHADREMRAREGQGLLEDGDLKEAMNAAQAIGDDALQKQSGGRVRKETFTHGTSDQRMRWFMKGYRTGRVEEGNTFDLDYNRL